MMERLEEYIRDSGYKKQYLAEAIHITPQSLKRKMNGARQWRFCEAYELSRILCISPDEMVSIFSEGNRT